MYTRFDEYVSECTRDRRVQEFQYESDVNELDRSLNSRRANWGSGRVRGLLHGLGHVLIGVGRRLDDLEQKPEARAGAAGTL